MLTDCVPGISHSYISPVICRLFPGTQKVVRAKSYNFETELPQNMNQHPYILMIRKWLCYKWDNSLWSVHVWKIIVPTVLHIHYSTPVLFCPVMSTHCSAHTLFYPDTIVLTLFYPVMSIYYSIHTQLCPNTSISNTMATIALCVVITSMKCMYMCLLKYNTTYLVIQLLPNNVSKYDLKDGCHSLFYSWREEGREERRIWGVWWWHGIRLVWLNLRTTQIKLI